MFLFKRDGHAVAQHRARRSAASGRTASRATSRTMDDWKTHLNTLFPEVRLKKTIEIRGADVQSTDLACALPALWTGILYDDRALAEAEALVEGWTHDEVADAAHARVARRAAGRRSAASRSPSVAERAGRRSPRAASSAAGSSTPRAGRTSACTSRGCASWWGRGAVPPTCCSRGSTARPTRARAIIERTTLK